MANQDKDRIKKDPILDAIHKKREAYAKKFNYDIEKIAADLKEKEKKNGFDAAF